MSLSKIRIVLDEPSHPGNIGAAARAMKTMGLEHLYLVRPDDFPSPEADARAVTAVDILQNALVVDELSEATGDCQLVIGVSGRDRELPLPPLDARNGGRRIREEAADGANVAVVFGTESTGLTNESLDACTFQLRIPANPTFKSLNLAAAVQLVCYEILMGTAPAMTPTMAPTEGQSAPQTVADPTDVPDTDDGFPSQNELEFFYRRLEGTLEDRHFYGSMNPERVNIKLRRFIARGRPRENELRLLHSLVGLMDRDSRRFKHSR